MFELRRSSLNGLGLAGNEGMEKMETIIMGYIGATIKNPFLHS